MSKLFDAFWKLPITDSHEHIERRDTAEGIVSNFSRLLDYFGYEKILLLGIHDLLQSDGVIDPTNSLMALYVKKRLNPQVYAFAGLEHFMDERDTAQGYLNQLKRAWAMGFDGLKLFETKPGMHRKLGYRLDGSLFEPMFDYAEAQRIPITIHLSDPAAFWGGEGADVAYLISRGWLCDETYPSRHQLFEEVENVMTAHPELRLTVAHLMCDNEDVGAATHFLRDYPNTGYDLTACASEYTIASRDPEAWREFFVTYADRLYFGTDQYNVAFEQDGSLQAWGRTSALLSRTVLESREDVTFGGEHYRTMNLPEDVVKRIYRDNFVTRLGEKPREINASLVCEDCERVAKAIESGAYGSRLGGNEAFDLGNLSVIKALFRQA